ncbi:MAG TPA: pitrilysin family protein [Chitinophagaceae bacterium]|jgi:predicted Zn-dependent peptidase|nr:pitrilysin family protein [Chitinophagaceae bacterium]
MKRLLILVLTLCTSCSLLAQASFKLPAYEKVVLKNGLTLYLMEQHEVPVISVSAIFPAGAIYDAGQSGLANMTATALMHGTRNRTKAQLEEALDFVGATVNTYASKESAGLSAKFAARDRNLVLDLIREILLMPSFEPAEFEKEKKLLLAELEQAKESPRNVIGNYFDQLSYGAHPYANPVSGRSPSVTALNAADARKFYTTHYVPNGSALAVVGDFSTREMKARLTALFGGWARGSLPETVAGQPVAGKKEATVLLVNKEDARETTFYIGGPGVPRSHPEYVAIEVVNTVLGGRFTSWLNEELRINTGLTYGAGSGFSPLKNAGTFRISTFTDKKNTEAAIDKALEVLNRLHTQGIDPETLTSAKNYVKGQYPPRYETAGQLAGLLTQMFWYGFNESFINQFQNTVDGLTPEGARAIVQKHFPKNNLQFVLVGRAEDIRKVAGKYGRVVEVDIKEESVKSF